MPNSEHWEQRYQDKNTPWDIREAAPPFVSLLASSSAPAPGRIAVLGCGRGYDAVLFAKHGFDVIGFDFATSAVVEAKEIAKLANCDIQFLQRDIFDLPKEFKGHFDYILEHTCFCAIDIERRLSYVEVASSILKPNGRLIGLFFTHNRLGGPPFGATPEEIKEYFQAHFKIHYLNPAANSVASRQGEEHLGLFESLNRSIGISPVQ